MKWSNFNPIRAVKTPERELGLGFEYPGPFSSLIAVKFAVKSLEKTNKVACGAYSSLALFKMAVPPQSTDRSFLRFSHHGGELHSRLIVTRKITGQFGMRTNG